MCTKVVKCGLWCSRGRFLNSPTHMCSIVPFSRCEIVKRACRPVGRRSNQWHDDPHSLAKNHVSLLPIGLWSKYKCLLAIWCHEHLVLCKILAVLNRGQAHCNSITSGAALELNPQLAFAAVTYSSASACWISTSWACVFQTFPTPGLENYLWVRKW